VPSKLIGTTVLITLAGSTIRILEPFTVEIAAEHQLVAPGEVSITDEHYGSARPDRPRRAPRARADAEKQFLALGDAATAFLTGAAGAGVATLTREISQILTLRAAHGDAALTAALTRAVEFRRWRADDVRSILASAGAAPGAPPGRPGAGADPAAGSGPAAERLRDQPRHQRRW
jgi:hypothetical protein